MKTAQAQILVRCDIKWWGVREPQSFVCEKKNKNYCGAEIIKIRFLFFLHKTKENTQSNETKKIYFYLLNLKNNNKYVSEAQIFFLIKIFKVSPGTPLNKILNSFLFKT